MKIHRRSFLALSGGTLLSAAAFTLAPVGTARAVTVDELMVPQALPDMVMGDANAPVTIIEYASMTCGHCATFHKQTLPALKERYIDTGKAKLILREYPLDARAAAAFMLARCSPEDKYYPMVSVLFEQQQTWAQAADARVPLLQIAKLAGFTQESFEACLSNQALLDKVRDVYQKAAKDYGVASTPTFFINGEMVTGALSIEAMAPYIDKHL
jgi:protein-disulfide isomerase